MRLDPPLVLEDRSDGRVVLEVLEDLLHPDKQEIVIPQLGRVLRLIRRWFRAGILEVVCTPSRWA
jgi:hypothetical protein